MIGQKMLLERIEAQVDRNNFPRFVIFKGDRGSEKAEVAEFTAKQLEAVPVKLPDAKVDTIRTMISDAYKVTSPVAYIIPDGDNLSPSARGALLKVTEEPPNNAYFMLLVEDEMSVIPTIRSRAQTFYLQFYLRDEIEYYFYEKYHTNHGEDEAKIVREICETPGEVDMLVAMGIKDFWDYVNLVAENIYDVSLANALKIPEKVATKTDADGYDMILFLRTFEYIVLRNGYNAQSVKETSKILIEARNKSVNKAMLLDKWVLNVRGD